MRWKYICLQWKGYNPAEYQDIIEKHNRVETEKRKFKRENKEKKKVFFYCYHYYHVVVCLFVRMYSMLNCFRTVWPNPLPNNMNIANTTILLNHHFTTTTFFYNWQWSLLTENIISLLLLQLQLEDEQKHKAKKEEKLKKKEKKLSAAKSKETEEDLVWTHTTRCILHCSGILTHMNAYKCAGR